jgi:polar amino acid transport system substrate-binding protein
MSLTPAAGRISRRRTLAMAALLGEPLPSPERAAALTLLTHRLPPFTTGTDAAPGGLAVELLREILRLTGTTGEIRTVPYPRLLHEVQAGPLTVGFIVARTPSRERLMQWIGPILVTGVYLYRRAGAAPALQTLEDARKLGRIGTTRGGIDAAYLVQHGFDNLDFSESQETDLRKLQLGRVDATPMGAVVFSQLLKETGFPREAFEQTAVRLYDSNICFALSPDVPAATMQAWSQALADLKGSGAYARMLARYGVATEEGARAAASRS